MTSHRISHRTAQKEFISFWVSPQLTLLQRHVTSDAPCMLQPYSQTDLPQPQSPQPHKSAVRQKSIRWLLVVPQILPLSHLLCLSPFC